VSTPNGMVGVIAGGSTCIDLVDEGGITQP
jgi:hypothetical protein